jgi:hypothetical protein
MIFSIIIVYNKPLQNTVLTTQEFILTHIDVHPHSDLPDPGRAQLSGFDAGHWAHLQSIDF